MKKFSGTSRFPESTRTQQWTLKPRRGSGGGCSRSCLRGTGENARQQSNGISLKQSLSNLLKSLCIQLFLQFGCFSFCLLFFLLAPFKVALQVAWGFYRVFLYRLLRFLCFILNRSCKNHNMINEPSLDWFQPLKDICVKAVFFNRCYTTSRVMVEILQGGCQL